MEEQEGGGTLSVSKSKLKKQRKNYNKDLVDVCNKFEQLGWRRSFIEKYRRERVDFDFEGETDEYWMQCAIDKAYVDNENKSLSLEELLYNVGLKKSVVKYLWNVVIEPIFDTCYTEEQLFDIAIEHIFGKTKPLFGDKPYYVNLPTENEWYYHKETKGFAVNYNESINIQRIIRDLEHKRNEVSRNSSSDKFYLFHCTAWKHAKSIIERGVKMFRGRECLDFGIDPGFYMTKDIKVALEWGQKKKGDWSNEIAIIIFELCQIQLQNHKVKVFEKANTDWKQLVKSSRKCNEEKNILDTFDFVYGPICKNPKNVAKEGKTPIAYNNLFQMVAKSRESESILDNNYIGCIWQQNNKY